MTKRIAAQDVLDFIAREGPARSDDAAWLAEVRKGNWSAIPEGLSFEGSGGLAMLLDGYRAAESLAANRALKAVAAARSVADRQLELYEQHGDWRGSALELWVTLFFEHRRNRFTIEFRPPEPGEEHALGGPPDADPRFDSIVTALRAALLRGDVRPKGR